MTLLFSHLSGNEVRDLLNISVHESEFSLVETLKQKIFNQFSQNFESYLAETDPDTSIVNNLNIRNPVCDYHIPEDIKQS